MAREIKVGKEDLYFFGEKLSPKDKVKVGKENELGELKIRVGFDAENEEDLIDIQLVDLMGSAQVYRMMVDLLGDEDPEQRVLEIAEQFVQSFLLESGHTDDLKYDKIGFRLYTIAKKEPVIDVLLEHKVHKFVAVA